MQITKTVNYKVRIKAILDDDGELKLSLSVRAPFLDREATASLQDFSTDVKEKVKAALEEALESGIEKAILLADIAASESLRAAVRRGEG